jgi:transposase
VEAIEEQIPAAEMERMMKLQEVILKAMAGKLTWVAAAEIIGVTDRTMRRWRDRWQQHGYSGLWDYRKRSPNPKRVPVDQLQQVRPIMRRAARNFSSPYGVPTSGGRNEQNHFSSRVRPYDRECFAGRIDSP